MNRVTKYIKQHDIKFLTLVLYPLILLFNLSFNALWIKNNYPSLSPLDEAQSLASILWVLPLPVAIMTLAGMLLYKKSTSSSETELPKKFSNTIYFRLVTRGKNLRAVKHTVRNVCKTMESFNKDQQHTVKYIVEVVADEMKPSMKEVFVNDQQKQVIRVLEVPDSYATKNDARFKARALHYAVEHSHARESDWILHLDEESQIDKSTVLGIIHFMAAEEAKLAADKQAKPRIGQGTILYYRNLQKSSFYTLADSIRTGDDIGRYYLQNLLQLCIFGMHGSFIFARNSVEKEQGFDLIPANCVTEDAYWGLRAMQDGYRTGHVSGYIHEQSPAKATDFIKQRRRWFVGLMNVIRADDLDMQFRLPLLISTLLWAFSGSIFIYTFLNIIHPVHTPQFIGVLASVTFAIYILIYIIGFYINMQYVRIPLYRKIIYMLEQIIFIPVFSLLEALGVLYGVLNPKSDFYVISK